jgi:hypothetical protein
VSALFTFDTATALTVGPIADETHRRLDAGQAIVVRLPRPNPYGPLMADLARAGLVVYIDRRGPWGNSWPQPGQQLCRQTAVDLHRRWLAGEFPDERLIPPRRVSRTWVLAHVGDLRGKVLACWCVPNPCHGHTLAGLAEAHPTGRTLRGAVQ